MARSLVRALFVVFLAAPSGGLWAQVIPVRTVPVASGDQYLLLPSASLAMGGVTLALDDSLADAWENPALGTLVGTSTFLGSPTFYSISSGGGAGRSFPVAALIRDGAWFGGMAFALQQIDNGRERAGPAWRWIDDVVGPWPPPQELLSDRSSRNLYARGFVGLRLGSGPWSVGLGLSAASLHAMDGVDLLYANAQGIDQHGTTGDVRVGLHRRTAQDRLSFLLLHDRVSMTHDVTYVDVVWDTVSWQPHSVTRVEVNEDRSRTWGGQVAWDRSLAAPGWRMGLSATVNHKSHPKIPDYEIQNIPRDPGETWAWALGVGLSQTLEDTRFGVDIVFQPIWSDTWQEGDSALSPTQGPVILPGGRTLENDFFFTNVVLRTGLSHAVGAASVQAGLEVRSYSYQMKQHDHVEGTFRRQDEGWTEWTPSVGATLTFSSLELRYAGRLTTGTGQPGVSLPLTPDAAARADALSDFILAPRAPLTLRDATVITHQLSIRVPIG
jgi:hypothetical protein